MKHKDHIWNIFSSFLYIYLKKKLLPSVDLLLEHDSNQWCQRSFLLRKLNCLYDLLLNLKLKFGKSTQLEAIYPPKIVHAVFIKIYKFYSIVLCTYITLQTLKPASYPLILITIGPYQPVIKNNHQLIGTTTFQLAHCTSLGGSIEMEQLNSQNLNKTYLQTIFLNDKESLYDHRQLRCND